MSAEPFCENCSAPVETGAIFCPHCGSRLIDEGPAAEAPTADPPSKEPAEETPPPNNESSGSSWFAAYLMPLIGCMPFIVLIVFVLAGCGFYLVLIILAAIGGAANHEAGQSDFNPPTMESPSVQPDSNSVPTS